MAGDGVQRWGLLEVGILVCSLVCTALIPWAYMVGTDLARIAVSVEDMRLDVKTHIELPKHSGAPSIEQFEKLDVKVDKIHEEQIQQRTILTEIRSAVKP